MMVEDVGFHGSLLDIKAGYKFAVGGGGGGEGGGGWSYNGTNSNILWKKLILQTQIWLKQNISYLFDRY